MNELHTMPTEISQGIEVTGLIPPAGSILEGLEQFGKRGEGLKLGTNGKFYNGWNGNQYVKTASHFDNALMKSIAKNAPALGTALDVIEVGEAFKEDGYTIGTNTIVESAGVAGSAGGAWAGAMTGAAIGSAFGPVGTLVGGIIGGIFGGWLGEEAAEGTVESIVGQ